MAIIRPHLALLTTCAVFSFLGGYVSQLRPTPAKAQTGAPAIRALGQLEMDNAVPIPNAGLRFVTGNNQTVMLLAARGGNAVLSLFDGAGHPSITLISGTKGEIIASTMDGATVVANTRGDSHRVLLGTTDDVYGLVVQRDSGDPLMFADTKTDGGILQLMGKKGTRIASIREGSAGGELHLMNSAGELRAALEAATFGKLLVTAQGKRSLVIVSGAGTVEGNSQEGDFKLPLKANR